MANPVKTPASHGQSGDAKPTPVKDYKSYGGGGREEVSGGPAGHGNDTGATTDTGRDWSTGDRESEADEVPKPVVAEKKEKNVFSRD